MMHQMATNLYFNDYTGRQSYIQKEQSEMSQGEGLLWRGLNGWSYIYFIWIQSYNYQERLMQEGPVKKYSKISPALKCYFLENLYYHCLSIRESAQKCRINYSTAKIILRDLTAKESKFVKRLLLKKERDEKDGMPERTCCEYKTVGSLEIKLPQVEVISRVGWNFFDNVGTKR